MFQRVGCKPPLNPPSSVNSHFHICYEVETWTNDSFWQKKIKYVAISLFTWLISNLRTRIFVIWVMWSGWWHHQPTSFVKGIPSVNLNIIPSPEVEKMEVSDFFCEKLGQQVVCGIDKLQLYMRRYLWISAWGSWNVSMQIFWSFSKFHEIISSWSGYIESFTQGWVSKYSPVWKKG